MNEIYKEEDFYKDDGSPSEELEYCHYIFWQDSHTEWGQDYDQFALVVNAEYPYLRLTRKRGNSHYPCGGSCVIATDGHFATLTDDGREEECPKIAWGITAFMLSKLIYSEKQKDYVLGLSAKGLFNTFYKKYLNIYLHNHNGLRFASVSDEQKELDFIDEHLALVKEQWHKSQKLSNYQLLFNYAKDFEDSYESFVLERKKEVIDKIMPKKNYFSTEIRSSNETHYIKVFFYDDSVAEQAAEAISPTKSIKTINVTQSHSKDHPGNTLTIYPKSKVPIEECLKDVECALNNFFANVEVGQMNGHDEAYFAGIEHQILEHLDKALATIDVCVAWFTNDKLRDKLVEKKAEGVKVRVITFRDGVNHAHGVDLTALSHKEYRGERGGIMHEKFCVIDNVTTINGSYNWTLNAENKNDEDAAFHVKNYEFASAYTKRFNEIWDRDGIE